MPGGRFEITLDALPEGELSPHGLERVEFLVSANPGQPAKPLNKVASGGELSRISLAIQVVTSAHGRVPTLIFDEVDTGIGGAVAAAVGRQLQALAGRRQVLCVTHLAQVAAHADHHFRVAKTGKGAEVATTLDRLKPADRVDELARMLAGTAITTKTRAHAKELYEHHRRTAA
jgi:DNA repair protein RecN (Recombination protein N)